MRKIERKRLLETLKRTTNQHITIINAPPGYGKTTAIKQYLKKYSEYSYLWIDLKNGKTIIDFPDKHKDIDFLIIDHIKEEHFQINLIKELLETKHTYQIIMMSSDKLIKQKFSNEIQWITTEMLSFNSYEEIRELADINKILINDMDVYKILEYSGGWIKGIEVLLKNYLLFKKVTITNDYKDIIEQDLFDKLNDSLRHSLCYLSEFTEFPIEILLQFAVPDEILNFLKRQSSIHWLVAYHEQRNTYSLMIPFKAFLSDKVVEYRINLREFRHYYAKLYERTNPIEALRFYEKIDDFDKIVEIMEKHSTINFKDHDPALMKKIYDGMPYDLLKKHPYVYLRMINDQFTTYKDIIHGSMLLHRFTSLLEEGYYKNQTKTLQGELYLIKGYVRFNDLEKMCHYFDKAYIALHPNVSRIASNRMIITYGCPHILFLYHNEPGKMKRIIELMKKHIKNYYEITNFSCVGLAQQAEAEYYMEIGMFQKAELLAMEAYYKAKEFNQTCIVIASLMTLGRIGSICFKKELFHYAISFLNAERGKDIPLLLKGEIDCAFAYLYAMNDEIEKIPNWLRNGQKRHLLNEINSYIYIAYGAVLVRKKQYFQLKIVADILSKIHVYHKHVFGDIYALLYKTIAYDQLKAKDQAKQSFKEFIELAEKDRIVMPCLEFSDLLYEYIKQSKNTPYIKMLKSKIKEKQQGWRTSVFSEREMEIIQYINSGYTRKRTADILKIKESTVSTMMKRIYRKANITNKDDLKDFCSQL